MDSTETAIKGIDHLLRRCLKQAIELNVRYTYSGNTWSYSIINLASSTLVGITSENTNQSYGHWSLNKPTYGSIHENDKDAA